MSIYTSDGDLTSPLSSSYSYRVEMAISDDTAEGTFVFDGVLTKLHSIRASEAAQMLVLIITFYIRDVKR